MINIRFKSKQYERVERLIKDDSYIFNGDSGGGFFRRKQRPFILQNEANNIYSPIKHEVTEYFAQNKISWWGGRTPTKHTLSSQIACLNHLFPIRQDKSSVFAIVKEVLPNIADVFTITTDQFCPAYIQFEAVSDADHLNELASTRGNNCTSIDALIWGKLQNGRCVILLIEWKYTETYRNENKASGDKGKTRKSRYTDLISKSSQLAAVCPDVYYYEPFYQLMRQTLWAEQMIGHKQTETVKADDFLHIHVIPPENSDLLRKIYPCSGKEMEKTWRECLKDQNKYRIIAPSALLSPVDREKYKDLFRYLQTRYW